MISSATEDLPQGTEGLLVVGEGRRRPRESLLLVENIIVYGLDQEQIVFQINANLGKMTVSDLIKNESLNKAA